MTDTVNLYDAKTNLSKRYTHLSVVGSPATESFAPVAGSN
jgi:hypothetical protein